MRNIVMVRKVIIASAAVTSLLASAIPHGMAADGKCTSIQARCAVEAGGECNPKTGWWAIGYWAGRYRGGTILAYDTCISRELARRK